MGSTGLSWYQISLLISPKQVSRKFWDGLFLERDLRRGETEWLVQGYTVNKWSYLEHSSPDSIAWNLSSSRRTGWIWRRPGMSCDLPCGVSFLRGVDSHSFNTLWMKYSSSWKLGSAEMIPVVSFRELSSYICFRHPEHEVFPHFLMSFVFYCSTEIFQEKLKVPLRMEWYFRNARW